MSRSRRSLAVLAAVLLALAAVVAGCGGEDPSEPAAAGGDAGGKVETHRVNLLIDFFPNGNHALFYLAREQGFFADEGLDVDIRHILGGAEVAKSIIAGQADFGYADLATMAVARNEQQADVTAIMGIQQQTPMAIISDADSGIRTPADLKGKKLVNFAGSSTTVVWPVLLDKNGLKEGDMKIQMVDPGSLHNLVLQNKADGFIQFYTDNGPLFATECECEPNIVRFRDHGIHTLSNGIIASSKFLQENPEVAERFVRAMQKALAASGEDPEAAVDALLKHQRDVSAPRDVLIQNVKNTFELARTEANQDEPFGYMAQEDWDATLRLMSEAGAMEDPGDPQQYYTNDYIDDSL